MSILLEVIVTSLEEAQEAEAGGADRVELLSSPEHAGLTPPLALVESVLEAVSIPVRVMLRPRSSMTIGNAGEIIELRETAARFARLPIDGLVAGYIRKGLIDEPVMQQILAAAPNTRFTFHRAFDRIHEQSRAIDVLKGLAQIDRVLASAGSGEWGSRVEALAALQSAAAPQIGIIYAVGRDVSRIADLRRLKGDTEVHVGRAARYPPTRAGAVSRVRVAALKRALNS
jgi:copper homeostasis protein